MHCPNCHFQNERRVAICAQCGRPLIPPLPRNTPPEPPHKAKDHRTHKLPPAPIPLDLCRVCGTTYPMNRTTCPLCLAPMGTIVNPNDPTGDTFRYVGYPYTENANAEAGDSR